MTRDPPRFGVLGPLEVVAGDGVPRPVGGRKVRALLALLILHRGQAVPASRLVDELWGQAPPRGAEVTLRSHVSHLRRHLADVAAGDALTTDPAGYRLALPAGQVDVDRFERLVGLAQEALGLGRPTRAVSQAREALALWRGRPFTEVDEVDAAAVEVARLEELRLRALEVLGAAELAAGRHREVVGELEALVAEHPFRERFCALLMVALYRSGRQAEALEAYAAARDRLADELGLDPGPELQALNQGVLRQDPGLLGDAGEQAPSVPATGADREAPRRPPDAVFAAMARCGLVGRAFEVGRLDAAWQDVATGGRHLVLVSGGAGIGKTHLVAGLAQRVADDGLPVLVGRCAAAGVPHGPVAEALRSSGEAQHALDGAPGGVVEALAPLLDEPVDVAGAPGSGAAGAPELTVSTAFAVVLRRLAADRPVLFVVDNADRIDPSSALLLGHLVERLPAGVLVVVCFRDPPGGRHPPLARLLGDVGTHDLTERIVLGPLGEAELADLVRDALPDVDRVAHRLWRHTGGNPFHAKEMARVLADTGDTAGTVDPTSWQVPVGVRDVLRHRLSTLSERAGEVLPVAAVLGPEVDVELLAQVSRVPEDEVAQVLEEGVADGLLVESGASWAGRYAFPHDLMRDALRSEVGGLRLRALHLRAAEALVSRARDGRSRSAAIAAHLRAAGPAADPGEAASHSLHAAREAARSYAWDEAIEHAEAAVTLLGQTTAAHEQADAAVTAGMLRVKSGRGFAEALDLLGTALRQFLATGDDESAGVVHSRLGGALCVHHSVMDIPRALEHFDAAERLLPTPEMTYHLHRGRSQAAMLGLRTALLAESSERAGSIAEDLGRRDLAVIAGWARGWGEADAGCLADAAGTWERGWRTAHEMADPYLGWMPVNAAALLANAYLLDPPTARAWCRRGLAQPQFTSFALPHGAVVDQLALALAAMGEVDGAHEAAEHLPPDAGARRMLLLLDGEWERAEASWAAAVAADEAAGDLHDAALNHRWLASARLALGDHDGAVSALERALELAVGGPQVPTELAARAVLARLLAGNRPTEADAHLSRCEEILSGGEDWRGLVGEVELARAAVASVRGDEDAANAASARAVEVFVTHRMPWREAAALVSWGDLLSERGDGGRAARRWTRAREAYAGIHAPDRWVAAVGSP
ncbi:MAG TPA: BTAD domain-containing putative transcriptional regulator [Ornithinibacter sp.]|nr:BTAD domain-containing putative transcriptional regulator [Ornithinibacter sp.]